MLTPFGHGKTFGDMVGRCMPISGPGGCPGTRVLIIFGSYVDPHFCYIEHFEVYGGLRALGGIPSCLVKFWSKAVRIMSGDPFWARVMTIVMKHTFCKGLIG